MLSGGAGRSGRRGRAGASRIPRGTTRKGGPAGSAGYPPLIAKHQFQVAYPGELTPEEERAFKRERFTHFQNAVGVAHPIWKKPGGETPTGTYQVLRVAAETPEEARRLVVEALGYEPDGLAIGR